MSEMAYNNNVMCLKIYAGDQNLQEMYLNLVEKTIANLESNYPDAGFDLYIPARIVCLPGETTKIDMGVKCAAYMNSNPQSFYVYPRSSISKTKLRLANSVGIIDSGYRGNLVCVVDNIGTNEIVLEKGMRLFQICSPMLTPIKVEVVNNLEVLGSTHRGSGGFGSTGGTIN